MYLQYILRARGSRLDGSWVYINAEIDGPAAVAETIAEIKQENGYKKLIADSLIILDLDCADEDSCVVDIIRFNP